VIRWRNKRTDARCDHRSRNRSSFRTYRDSQRAAQGREAQSASTENRRRRTWNETPRQHGFPAEEVVYYDLFCTDFLCKNESPQLW